MKNVFALLVISLLLFPIVPSAAIWTVDNNPHAWNTDFSTLQEANDQASAGDTLYVIGSGVTYESATINRQLTIFGPGYFLGENPETQASTNDAVVGGITLAEEGCIVAGIHFVSTLEIQAPQCVVMRNYMHFSHADVVTLNSDASFTLVQQNYIYCSSSYDQRYTIDITGAANCNIENNYIYKQSDGYAIRTNDGVSNLTIRNNVINGTLRTYYSELYNNILVWGGFTNGGQTNSYHHNLSDGYQFGDEDGNIPNVDMGDVFVDEGTTDGQWMLSDTSPAAGAGHNGEDCGMFGGANPYILSGIPPIPTITSFHAPSTGSEQSGIQIDLNVKARN